MSLDHIGPKTPEDVAKEAAEYLKLKLEETEAQLRLAMENQKVNEASVKDTNPKDAIGVTKAPMSTVPAAVMLELGVAMLEGSCKYGRHNYRFAGVRASVYYDALMRHVMEWYEGTDLDEDSGLSHIIKAIATLTVLRDAMLNNMVFDDRPIGMVCPDWLKTLNEKTAAIIAKYPNPKEPYLAKDYKKVED
jgi:hypothetical protein